MFLPFDNPREGRGKPIVSFFYESPPASEGDDCPEI